MAPAEWLAEDKDADGTSNEAAAGADRDSALRKAWA